MRNIKSVSALLIVLAMLVAVPFTAVSAQFDPSVVIAEEVLHSITVEETTGNGLAYLFTMRVAGATVNSRNEFVGDNATVEVDGVTYQVVKMGAVLTNQAAYAATVDALTLDDVNVEKTVIDIPAKYLFDYSESECSFAVRIVNIPAQAKGYAVACRPYIVLADEGGNETAVYGGGDIATYYQMYYYNSPEETPALDVDFADVDDRIAVTASSAEYVTYAPTTYREALKVAVTLENVSANAATSSGDWVEYTCYDAEGNAVATEQVTLGTLAPGFALSAEFYAPIGTASVEATATNLNYVPAVTLPAIGSDIDVTKNKNRIVVNAASAAFNNDGTIAVSLTFKNKSKNWITEETDWVEYTCYDADGNVVQAATKIYIGCIDTKKNVSKTFNFNVPATTTEVKLTDSKIVYWTEWA